MIGKYTREIGPDEFLAGMAESDYATNGAIGTSSYSLNPFHTPGRIKATYWDDASTNVAGDFIASCEDASATLSNNRYFVDSSRNYYSWNGTAITKQKTASAGTYTFGITDMTPYNGKFYTTTTSDITEWNGTTTLDENYWTTTKSQAALKSGSGQPHPLLVYEGLMWIGDGNLLHYINSSGTVTNSKVTLAPNEAITALGIDPGTGMMLIATSTSIDLSTSISAVNAIYLYDGVTAKPRRKVLVDNHVLSFKNVGGSVYVGYGQNIGIWTGAGIQFLRKLKNASLSSVDLPYKHKLANINQILFFVDGKNVIAYGEVTPGRKVFYPVWQEYVTATKINIIANIGANKIGTNFATNKFKWFDITSSSGAAATYYTPFINFPRPAFIRRVRIITSGITTTAGIGLCQIIDELGNNRSPAVNTFKVSSGTRYVFDFDFTDFKVNCAQLNINMDTQGFSIIRATIYYDTAE